MTTTNTNCEVSTPSKRLISRIKNKVGYIWCIKHLNDDIIYTTVSQCNMNQDETCRRLKMIHDVVDSDFGADEVWTMFKECNMDHDETCRRLKMIHDVKEVASNFSVDEVCTMLNECNMDPSEATQRLLYIDTFQEVKKKKDTRKSVSDDDSVQEVELSNGDTVQEAEKKKDTGKTVSNGDFVQEVEQKKDTGKTVSNGDFVQEVEQKKDTGKTVSNSDFVQEAEKKKSTKKNIGNWDNQLPRASRERQMFYPSKVYNVGRRNLTSVKKEWRPKSPVEAVKESNGIAIATPSADVNGKLAVSNTSHSHKLAAKVSSGTVSKHTTASVINTHSASRLDDRAANDRAARSGIEPRGLNGAQ